MDLKKIGAFIAMNRRAKGLTQQQLADQLGVTNKTVSRWETGKYMPDLSLLKPICESLDISLNELLSGEPMETEHLAEKTETNIINTVEYTKQEIKNEHRKISILFISIGILINISVFLSFDSFNNWNFLYSMIGAILFTAGVYRELKTKKRWKKASLSILMTVGVLTIFYMIDYASVATVHRPPVYGFSQTSQINGSNVVRYSCLFYNVYRINADSKNEYYLLDRTKKYTLDTVPVSPFDREKSGMEHIIKYKNRYIGNNSNDGNLLSALPLSEYGFAFEIDSENMGLVIDYMTTDWYGNDNLYVEKSMIYNSIAIFSLIDNAEYVIYNFSGNSYKVTRQAVEENYPNYSNINQNHIDGKMFQQYVEDKMNDTQFAEAVFPLLFQAENE